MNSLLLEQIETTAGKNAKLSVLAKADPETQLFIALALDPDITYGITAEERECFAAWNSVARKEIDPKKWWLDVRVFLGKCADRSLTGDAAGSNLQALIWRAPTQMDLKWFCRMVNKNLRAGFDVKSFNKTFPNNQIITFNVQLADTYEGGGLVGDWWFEPKLDGNRVIAIDERGKSRNGKIYDQASHVIAELKRIEKNFFERFVLDGEMMGNLGFDQSSGALRRKDKKNQDATFTYWVWDMLFRDEWSKKESRTMQHRHYFLEDWLKAHKDKAIQHIKLVPHGVLKNPTHQQIMGIARWHRENGFEGAMAKDMNAQYEWDRGPNVLKIKEFFDKDLRVIGFYEGKGKHEGRLGGVVVDNNGVEVKVGSGFDDETRELVWQNKQNWLNAVVQVQYFEETKDGSLRFPVFIMRRRDKE